MRISSIIRLMRPHQYIKNGFIFLPLFFAVRITDTALLLNAFVAFLAFSLAASAVYILNDYHDIDDDRCHPKNKDRPLAAGTVNQPQALAVMGLLFIAGAALMVSVSFTATVILLAYVAMNMAYNVLLKHVAILDVTTISIGFVLRLFVGSVVTGIPLSNWIVIMTFLLALFIALAKRRDDVLIYLDTGRKMRNVTAGYNLQFLNTAMAIMASVVIVAYTTYTTSTEVVARVQSDHLYLTALFVIVGIMRFLQISLVAKASGSPTRIVLKDRFMQLTLIGWVTAFAWLLY